MDKRVIYTSSLSDLSAIVSHIDGIASYRNGTGTATWDVPRLSADDTVYWIWRPADKYLVGCDIEYSEADEPAP